MDYNKTEIAKKTGISRQCISKILNGQQKNPKIKTLESIAAVLGISVEELCCSIKKDGGE